MFTKNVKLVLVATLVVMNTACATGPTVSVPVDQAPLTIDQLRQFSPNCAQKADQLNYLYRMLPAHTPNRWTQFTFRGSDQEYSMFTMGMHRSMITYHIEYLQTYCP